MTDNQIAVPELEGFEKKIKEIEKPKKVLAELCKQAGQISDFCCLLKLNDDRLTGWVFHSRTPMPEFDVAEISFKKDEVPKLAYAIQNNVPVENDKLELKSWDNLRKKRKMNGLGAVIFFPVMVGQKTPFVFMLETNDNISAEFKGYLNRWITTAGMKLSSLIMQRRRSNQKELIPPRARGLSRLIAENWVSAYSEVKQNKRWKRRNLETKPTDNALKHTKIQTSSPLELELSDAEGIE